MLGQQLQDAHVLANARPRTVPLFQPLAEFPEHGGQLPIAIHVGMIQSGRATLQSGQIMHRVQHIVAGVIAAVMNRDDRFIQHDLDAIHVAFDRHDLKRRLTRHAVVHVVKPRELILVDLRRLPNAGIKPPLR